MAAHAQLQTLVLSALHSQERATAVIASLQDHNDFTPIQHQLSAFGRLLQHLQQIPDDQNSAFSNITPLLKSTTVFCENIVADLQVKAKSPSTDWSSSKYLGGNIQALSDKLKLYTSSLAIGAIHSAR